MAKAVEEVASKTSGKKSLAVEAFSRALRQVSSFFFLSFFLFKNFFLNFLPLL